MLISKPSPSRKGVNACGLANWVVVPIPPPFIQGRTQEETRAKAAVSSMGTDPRTIMPANEQFPMPDKNAATNNPTRPVSTVVQSRDAGIIIDSSSGIKYNSLNGAWFDPSKGGWTTDRPKAAPANMGPGSAAATASRDAATAVHTTPSLQEAQALKAGVLYDSGQTRSQHRAHAHTLTRTPRLIVCPLIPALTDTCSARPVCLVYWPSALFVVFFFSAQPAIFGSTRRWASGLR